MRWQGISFIVLTLASLLGGCSQGSPTPTTSEPSGDGLRAWLEDCESRWQEITANGKVMRNYSAPPEVRGASCSVVQTDWGILDYALVPNATLDAHGDGVPSAPLPAPGGLFDWVAYDAGTVWFVANGTEALSVAQIGTITRPFVSAVRLDDRTIHVVVRGSYGEPGPGRMVHVWWASEDAPNQEEFTDYFGFDWPLLRTDGRVVATSRYFVDGTSPMGAVYISTGGAFSEMLLPGFAVYGTAVGNGNVEVCVGSGVELMLARYATDGELPAVPTFEPFGTSLLAQLEFDCDVAVGPWGTTIVTALGPGVGAGGEPMPAGRVASTRTSTGWTYSRIPADTHRVQGLANVDGIPVHSDMSSDGPDIWVPDSGDATGPWTMVATLSGGDPYVVDSRNLTLVAAEFGIDETGGFPRGIGSDASNVTWGALLANIPLPTLSNTVQPGR